MMRKQDRARSISWRIFATVLTLFCFAIAPSAQAQGKRPITFEDLWAVKRMGTPSISPNGEWTAVEVTTYDMAKNSGTSDIWLLGLSGREQRQLTTHTARDSSPLWSPNGKTVAFLSRREGDESTQIYLIAPEGGEARRLTKLSTGASGIKWFADSKRIAFISWVWPDLKTDEEQAKRAKERSDSKVKAYVIDTTQFRYWDHWLTDGKVPHIFVADVATGEVRDVLAGTGLSMRRTDDGPDLFDVDPEGREIAFVTDLTKDPGFRPNDDIVVLDLGTGKWKNITEDNAAGDGSPRYSPDGRWLAYTRNLVPEAPDRSRLVLVDRKTGAKQTLAEKWDYSINSFEWSAGAEHLYLIAEEKAQAHVWMLDPAAGAAAVPKAIIRGGTISGLSVAGMNKHLAFLRTTMGKPAQVFTSFITGEGEVKRDRFNDDLIAQWQLGDVKSVDYKGWNGEPVQMWVVYPPGFDPKKKWPLMQIIHGGPHGATLDQFHFRWNLHLFASRGYVVASVNYHGSPGWGDAFTDSIKGMYGVKEMADIEAGTDWLLAQGYIDKDRLAAAGGSFGGYLVAWMNGHTDRYKAYVCHAGVYDFVSQMASDYIRGRQRAYGGFPWENPTGVLEHSAHAFAKNFKTPTLVVHNENDYRVPVTQGFEYYTTLRMLGVPARLLYFPDENHWVLKPQNSRLWHSEFFAWVEKYAAPGGK